MHELVLDRWTRRQSPLHRLDARVKIAATLGVLLSIALTPSGGPLFFACVFALISLAAAVARLPVPLLMLRGLVVLPFVGGVIVLNLFGGEPERAAVIFARAYHSAYSVALLLASTPFHHLLRGLDSLGMSRFFLMVLHFVYRYLFVLWDQAMNILRARSCRAARAGRRALFAAASGGIAVLFARSYRRAENIHRAMLVRGFQGHFLFIETPRITARDWTFLALAAALLAALQLAVRLMGGL